MTDTIPRPRTRRSARPAARPGLLRAGIPAAGWAATAGLVAVAVPVLLLWAADSRSGAGVGAALRTVASVWLVAHGATLHVPGGDLGMTPLGLLALPLLLLERAARHAAGAHEVRSLRDAARLAAGVAGPYALTVAVVAGLAGGGEVQPDAVQALVGASVLGLVGSGIGAVRAAGLADRLWARLPARLQRATVPAVGALSALLGAGALLVGLMLVAHLRQAADIAALTTPGVVGGLGLLLLGLLVAPGAAVWGACYLAGPGFAVGVGTAVWPFGVTLGPVPAVPLLAALPGGPLPLAVGVLVPALPLAAGVLAGRLAHRRGGGLADALLAAPLTGAGMALLAALSAGPLGDGRLSQLGPSWWRVGLAVTLEVVLGAAAWEGLPRLWRRLR